MIFSDKIRALRKERKMSQGDLAKEVGVSLRTYRNWEVEGRYPKDKEMYVKLSEILGCSVCFLMCDDVDYPEGGSEQISNTLISHPYDILNDAKAVFSSSVISDDDKLAFINELKDIFMNEKLKSAPKTTFHKTSA